MPFQANDQPVLLGIPGSPHLYLACFSTPEKLQGTMELAGIAFDKIKQVEEGYDFFTSIPRDVKIILDPYFLPNGRIRFTELMFD